MKKTLKSILCSLACFAFAVAPLAGQSKTDNVVANAQVTATVNRTDDVQFTRVPSGTTSYDLASGIWNNLDWYDCNNLLVGSNENETTAYYKLMWDSSRVFFGFKSYDATPNDSDKIEIGIKYGATHWGYIFATYGPWVGLSFGNSTGYTFIDYKQSSDGKTREIYFCVTLKDTTCLKEGDAITLNMNYYDYDAKDGNLLYRSQSGIQRSGDPCFLVPFAVADQSKYQETPDTTLYDHILKEQTPSEEDTPNTPEDGNNSSTGKDEAEESAVSNSESSASGSGCLSAVGLGSGMAALGLAMSVVLIKKKK